jgi:Ca-activated chloride channel family protein
MNAQSDSPPSAPGTGRRHGAPALLALVMLLLAAGQAPAAGLLVADNGTGGLLEIQEHSVHVTINNGIAVTEVTQVFKNTEHRQVEALYTFPVPKNASVSNFSMWINGKEMIGEVVEKQRAREIYDTYKRVRRDPGLLEQTDYRTFEMRIFPIAPLAEQKVQIIYYQQLDFDDDWATYVYPLATNTRRAVNSRTSGKFSFTLDAKSEIPIVAMESPSHGKKFAFAKHSDNYQQASLEAKGADLNRDVVIAYHLARPKTGIDMITSKQGAEDGYFCLSLTAGEELAKANPGMDYVFLLDISGSMNDDDKLDLSRHSLDAFIRALGKDDRFEVVTFNVQPATLFRQLTPADDASKSKAATFLASQEARGGTVLHSAITTAYKYNDPARALNVVILSDGLTEQEERPGLVRLIRERPTNSRVFCIGVGNDVDRGLLQQIADETGGLAAFLSQQDDLARQAGAFRRKLTRPVMTDLAFDFQGADVYDLQPAPQKLPSLYHGSPLVVYGRYRGAGPAKITVHGKIGDKPVEQTVPLDFPKEDDRNPEVERMWAWKKIDRLLNGPEGSRSSSIDEVVRLGETYSIASEYTSFIVLENDNEYARWKITQRNAFRLARDRDAQQQVATQLQALREKAAADLGPALPEKSGGAPVAASPVGTPTANPADAPQAPASAPPMDVPQGSTPASRHDGSVNPAAHPNSQDVNVGSPGSGGGAIDPLSGAIVLALGAIALSTYIRARGSRKLAA